MKYLVFICMIYIFYGCSSKNTEIQTAYSVGVGWTLNIPIFEDNQLNKKNKFNKFLSLIEHDFIKKQYINCLSDIGYGRLNKECRDLYHESVKNCFIKNSYIACGIVSNLSTIYQNNMMSLRMKKKLKEFDSNIEIKDALMANNYLLTDIDKIPSSNIIFSIYPSFFTKDLKTFTGAIGFGFTWEQQRVLGSSHKIGI